MAALAVARQMVARKASITAMLWLARLAVRRLTARLEELLGHPVAPDHTGLAVVAGQRALALLLLVALAVTVSVTSKPRTARSQVRAAAAVAVALFPAQLRGRVEMAVHTAAAVAAVALTTVT